MLAVLVRQQHRLWLMTARVLFSLWGGGSYPNDRPIQLSGVVFFRRSATFRFETPMQYALFLSTVGEIPRNQG